MESSNLPQEEKEMINDDNDNVESEEEEDQCVGGISKGESSGRKPKKEDEYIEDPVLVPCRTQPSSLFILFI